MYSRTPFRQLSRIYSSILALGRLPETAKAMADQISETVRNGAERNAASTREFVEQIRLAAVAPEQSSTAPPEGPSPSPASRLLDQFRSDLLRKIEEPLLCIDVGARWGADSALLALKERAKLLCFEPDEQECARLQVNFSPDVVEYVPLALSANGGELTLTITREPACISAYPPIDALHQHYPALALIEPLREAAVPSVRLDNYLVERGLPKPDLLKLDTQGSELDILRGGLNSLSEACLLDVEVEFNPIYQGQPLFSDIDQFMRANGFSLWRLPMMVHYPTERFAAADTPLQSESVPPNRVESINPGNGQLFWGNAHYVRTEFLASDPRKLSTELARRAAVVASAYGYWDLALTVLEKCEHTAFEASTLRGLLSLE